MDDTTKKIAISVLSGVLRKGALLAAGSLATHGIAVSGNFTEIFVSLGVGAAVAGYSIWQDFGRPIVMAKLEVLKAKALAQSAALDKRGIPQPNAVEIAEHSPTLTPAEVVKVTAAMPDVPTAAMPQQ